MKKVFTFNVENKTRERQLDSIKYEIRKYIKREKRKKLPEGVDYWKFECQFGQDAKSATAIDFLDITQHIDESFKNNSDAFYIEIIATQGIKEQKEQQQQEDEKEESTQN